MIMRRDSNVCYHLTSTRTLLLLDRCGVGENVALELLRGLLSQVLYATEPETESMSNRVDGVVSLDSKHKSLTLVLLWYRPWHLVLGWRALYRSLSLAYEQLTELNLEKSPKNFPVELLIVPQNLARWMRNAHSNSPVRFSEKSVELSSFLFFLKKKNTLDQQERKSSTYTTIGRDVDYARPEDLWNLMDGRIIVIFHGKELE